MNDRLLLELATDVGHRLAMCGAETFRIEESVARILHTYGYEAEVFAIPNCLTVSIITAEGKPMTRMRRIGNHGNDMDALIRYNELSRQICSAAPPPEKGFKWLKETNESCVAYALPGKMLGYFLGAFGFCLFFGGDFLDAFGAGICGLLILLVDTRMENLQSPHFFRTILGAFFSAMLAYTMGHLGLIHNADAAIIGALMILVPGLLFTNAMRDVMYGDTNSGLNRVVQVLLIAAAIALGTAGALNFAIAFWSEPLGTGLIDHGIIMQNVACFIGCIGFSICFNIHGVSMINCSIGGVLAWSAYLIIFHFTGDVIIGNLAGGVVAAVFSEVLARIWKKPALCYQVVALFPLLPGAGLYYTMSYAVSGDAAQFAHQGMDTAAVAGSLALGILLVATSFRLWSAHMMRKKTK